MDHYGKARREGLRIYTLALQAHEDPYLPVLEAKVPELASLSRLSLGIITVPLSRVMGSVSEGRSRAFTKNFLPILDGGSEFAAKWDHLYESVESEGVNQPITALEYMGYYYVIEGNKRVSVMKAMGSRDIEADVTRVYPPRSEDPEVVSYYEYCDFVKETGLHAILFSRPGSYQKLVSLPGMKAGEKWTEDEILSLRKIFHYFSEAYETSLQDISRLPTGDAFLAYLTAFSYPEVRDEDLAKTKERVRLMAREFETHDGRVNLVMDRANPAPAVPIISSLFRPSKLKAAFLFNRPIEDSAWNYWHNLGRLEAEEKLNGKLETGAFVVPSRAGFEETVDRLIKEGYSAFLPPLPSC